MGTYVNKALDTGALELTTVKLLNGCSQICSSLEFDKATTLSLVTSTYISLSSPKFNGAYPRPLESRPVSEYTTSRLD
jgi:hypothetical protein